MKANLMAIFIGRIHALSHPCNNFAASEVVLKIHCMQEPTAVAEACLTIGRRLVQPVVVAVAEVNCLFLEAPCSTDFAGSPAASAAVCNFPMRSSERRMLRT
jgi:hypothetical protein